MFRAQHQLVAVALAFSVLCATFGLGTGSPPPPTTAQPEIAAGDEFECRAADNELQRLRQSCDVAVAAFEACRASRPEWRGVELFSCGFDISTSLARGDVEAPASIDDCGAASVEELRADCPVPACEADLEQMAEELADAC